MRKTKAELEKEIRKLIEEYRKKRDKLSQHANHRGKYNQFIADVSFLLVDRD